MHQDGHSQLGLAIARSSLERRAKLKEVATVAGWPVSYRPATECPSSEQAKD